MCRCNRDRDPGRDPTWPDLTSPRPQAHVVEAFEQSLTSMTKKLHQITLSSEQKDKDMVEMRKQIDRLQRALSAGGGSPAAPLTRQTSNESISSLSSACSAHSQQSSRTPDSPGSKKKKKKGWVS